MKKVLPVLPVKNSAKALIISAVDPSQMLLVKEQLKDGQVVYDLPGGKIEPGETETTALQRELIEELFITVEIGEKLGEYSFVTIEPSRKVICQTYLCRFDPSQPIDLTHNPALNEHLLGVEWLPISTVISTPPPGIDPSFILLLQKL